MTEQELREKFEKIKNDNGCIGLLNNEFKWFQKGYSLAQETIKAKDAEIESMARVFNRQISDKDKAIAEARVLFLNHIAIFESQGLQWCCKKDIQETKAWLEDNK